MICGSNLGERVAGGYELSRQAELALMDEPQRVEAEAIRAARAAAATGAVAVKTLATEYVPQIPDALLK